MTAERDARNETTWKVDTDPTPLDTLAVSPLGIECWYRIPSWRVHFDHEALRDYDIRLHRAIGSHGVWTLTEASTGLKMHGDMPHEFYIGDESGMLAEFAAFKLKQLTPVKMADAISKGREMLNKRTPNPFAAPSTLAPQGGWRLVKDGFPKDQHLHLLVGNVAMVHVLFSGDLENFLKAGKGVCGWTHWMQLPEFPSATAPTGDKHG